MIRMIVLSPRREGSRIINALYGESIFSSDGIARDPCFVIGLGIARAWVVKTSSTVFLSASLCWRYLCCMYITYLELYLARNITGSFTLLVSIKAVVSASSEVSYRSRISLVSADHLPLWGS